MHTSSSTALTASVGKYKRRPLPAWVAVGILLLYALFSTAGADDRIPAELESLQIATAKQEQTFRVEVARTTAQRRQGLMFRQHLPDRQGMLFIYAPARHVNMWMKNTYIALDILFINEEGNVSALVQNTQPLSEKLIASRGPVRAVLELPAGSVTRYQLQVGQAVKHPAISPGDTP